MGCVAHLVAGLSHVDGTVLMTDCLEILGFGVEIAGELPEVLRVARAHVFKWRDSISPARPERHRWLV